jgi:hypothetical protein
MVYGLFWKSINSKGQARLGRVAGGAYLTTQGFPFAFRSIRYEVLKTCPKAGERKPTLPVREAARIKLRTLELQIVFMRSHSFFNSGINAHSLSPKRPSDIIVDLCHALLLA